jgi:hypothetical protein
VRTNHGVRVECLRCHHVGMLSDGSLLRQEIKQKTPIAAFIKRLRCSRCGSHSVSAQRVGPGSSLRKAV